jgi:hypothetical protein
MQSLLLGAFCVLVGEATTLPRSKVVRVVKKEAVRAVKTGNKRILRLKYTTAS